MEMEESKSKGGRKPGQKNGKRSIPENIEEALLRLDQVLLLIPISRSTLYGLIKDGRFPAPTKLGSRTSVWKGSDIKKIIINAE